MKFTIPGKPVGKKNSMRIILRGGHPALTQSDEYKAYEELAGLYIPNKWDCLQGPVNVKCVYYVPDLRRRDLANLQQATLDILVKYGVLRDDCWTVVQSMDGSRVYLDKDKPRAEIEITEVAEEGA